MATLTFTQLLNFELTSLSIALANQIMSSATLLVLGRSLAADLSFVKALNVPSATKQVSVAN